MFPYSTPPSIKEPIRETPSKSNATSTANAWRTVSLILGLLLAGGTVVSVAGKAFYVTRSEYTEHSQNNAVEYSQIHSSVDSIKTSLKEQETAFRTLTETVNNLRIEMVKSSHQRNQ